MNERDEMAADALADRDDDVGDELAELFYRDWFYIIEGDE